MIGETLGNYRILSTIGKGGMGVVYLAEHTLIGRKAAVKLLLPEMSRDNDLVERFFTEAKAAAMVQHAGLVEVFDFGHHTDGSAFIVMEVLQGESLARRLEREPRFPPELASAIARQVASALLAAHNAGIVHRDLKPENIFLIPDDVAPGGTRIKVLDFGIAKLAREDAPRSVKTKTGTIFGTPRYMSPEQCKSASNVDARTDIYALGCIFFEMLVGVAPFDYDNWGELVAAHIHETPPSPSELVGDIPSDVEAVVQRALVKDPAGRFQSMLEFSQAIDRVWPNMASRSGRFTPLPNTIRVHPVAVVNDTLAGSQNLGTDPTINTQPPKPRRLGILLAIGAAVLAAGIAIVIKSRKPDEKRVAAAPDAAIVIDAEVAMAVDAAPSTDASPRMVTLEVDSQPSGAIVYREVDGVKVGTTPFTREFERTDGEIAFLVKLAGYRDARVTLPTGQDGKHVETLVKQKAGVASKPPKPPKPPKQGSGSGPTVLDPYGPK